MKAPFDPQSDETPVEFQRSRPSALLPAEPGRAPDAPRGAIAPRIGCQASPHCLGLRAESTLFLARVIGSVVASVKYPGLEGVKLLVVYPISSSGEPVGRPLVACDVGTAGPGDRVSCVSSREATHVLPDPFVPVDAAVVGIVDAVDRGGRST